MILSQFQTWDLQGCIYFRSGGTVCRSPGIMFGWDDKYVWDPVLFKFCTYFCDDFSLCIISCGKK